MKYIYHYSGTCQDNWLKTGHIEGIIKSPCKVDSMHKYEELKQLISDKADAKPSNVVITSLSFLHEEHEN